MGWPVGLADFDTITCTLLDTLDDEPLGKVNKEADPEDTSAELCMLDESDEAKDDDVSVDCTELSTCEDVPWYGIAMDTLQVTCTALLPSALALLFLLLCKVAMSATRATFVIFT